MVTEIDGKARVKDLSPVLRAIADPKRRQILDLLAKQDMPVGRIAERFRISRPAIIKHLRILHSARLISVRRCGRERIQSLNTKPLKGVEQWMSRLEALWDHHLERLKQQVESDL
jgi:DNA-binding transcriptional ArsR family regulator